MVGPVRLRKLRQPAVFPEWQPAQARRIIESGEFRLLNVMSGSEKGIPWSTETFPRLWVYHLNYCDFVNLDLTRSEDRPLLRKALAIMADWCEQNATGAEAGWEPYPLSLRIVNWLKFLLRNAPHLDAIGERAAVAEILSSLRRQVCALERKLEFHLGANHLLKNIKALMFAGELLGTRESNRWWTRGAKLLESQLKEQILPDGGHFERSPMYHAEVLEDLLDLQTLISSGGRFLACAPALSEGVDRMADFLAAMLHPDGEISLFNDSAFGIAPAAQELLSRVRRLKKAPDNTDREVQILAESGYAVVREARSKSRLVFDFGPLGPNYQPGHGHCDVLSYELSLQGQRVVVDTGVSTYEPGRERHYERSTAAHNTFRIDGEEQAEIWASFRVGHRPSVAPVKSGKVEGYRFVRGAHYGYQRLDVVHTRQIILCPGNSWVIVDWLQGKGRHRIESFVHFHPKVHVEAWPGIANFSLGELQNRFLVQVGGRRYFLLSSREGTFTLKEAWYSPEFGRREKQAVGYWTWEALLPGKVVCAFAPADCEFPNVSLQPDEESIKIGNVQIPLS